MSAILSISQAINKTEANIQRTLPPVTIITATGRPNDDFRSELMLSVDIVQKVASLP